MKDQLTVLFYIDQHNTLDLAAFTSGSKLEDGGEGCLLSTEYSG